MLEQPIRRRKRPRPTPPGAYFHDRSRPLYLGLGSLVDSSVTGRLRSSTYRELSTPGYARERIRFGPVELMDGQRIIRSVGVMEFDVALVNATHWFISTKRKRQKGEAVASGEISRLDAATGDNANRVYFPAGALVVVIGEAMTGTDR